MAENTWFWAALGGLGLYLIFRSKKAAAWEGAPCNAPSPQYQAAIEKGKQAIMAAWPGASTTQVCMDIMDSEALGPQLVADDDIHITFDLINAPSLSVTTSIADLNDGTVASLAQAWKAEA